MVHTCHPSHGFRDETCVGCVMDTTNRFQKWRPQSLTVAMMMTMGRPFCWKCGDWHEPEAECSMTDVDVAKKMFGNGQ